MSSLTHRILHLFLIAGLIGNAKSLASSKGRKTAGKGFGSSQPSLQEIVAKFRTRMPEKPDERSCPCGTGKLYGECCAPFHEMKKLPNSPEDVLRSRYTAFAVSSFF